MITEAELLDRIVSLGGLDAKHEAIAALRAALAALGEQLDADARRAIAQALPEQLGAALNLQEGRGTFDLAEFYDHVWRREGVSLGFAREHAQIVCRVLGESLPGEALGSLDRALPAPFAALFHSPSWRPALTQHPLAHDDRHHTLATGRPGAKHPLSESAPPGAQSHSVVREANPHGDTKISSAAGMTQERLDESLATARPDDHRTIAKASD
jgi:uncharacterized protein (DUF2267 family)